MKLKSVTKRLTKWDWYAAAAFAVLVVIVFHGFIFTDKMFFGSDMIPMGYMMRQVVADYWRANGTIPLWDPYILGGLPVVDAMHGDLFYPPALLYLVMPLHKALGYKIVLHVWLAGIGMYVLLRTLALKRWPAFLGGLCYMTAPYFLSLIYAGHDGKMFVTALFPLCVAALELLLRYVKYIYAVVFGAVLGLLFLTAHPQMTYFAAWGLAIYFFFKIPRLARSKMLARGSLYLVIALLLGIGIGCVQFLPTYYYTTNFSPRTGGVTFAFASSWSLHPEEIVSLMYPMFGGYLDSYWGRNPFKLNAESPGPLVLLLAIGGFIYLLKRRDAWPWLLLFIFCPLYALGAHTPLLKAAFYTVPGAKFLRAPSIIMFMFSCASSVLAAFLVDSLLAKQITAYQKKILTALLVLAAATTILFTAGRGALFSMWQGLYGNPGSEKVAIIQRYGGELSRDALIVGLCAGAALLLATSRYRNAREGKILLGVLLAGVLATSLPHSMRFVQYLRLGDWLRRDPVIEQIRSDKDISRVLPATSADYYNRNYLPLFGIQTANGFYDNRIRYYETLTGTGQQNLTDPNIMRITNVKYVVTSQRVNHPLLALERDFKNLFLYRNRGFVPRASIVHNALVAESDSAALKVITSPSFDPSTTIVLAADQFAAAMSGTGDAGAEEWAEIETYLPDRVKVRARAASPGYLFFTENYLPYWKAYVDGREVPLLRCDIAMRAVHLEPGEHSIEMKFSSKWYRIGAYVCLVSCLIVVGSAAAAFRRPGRRSRDG